MIVKANLSVLLLRIRLIYKLYIKNQIVFYSVLIVVNKDGGGIQPPPSHHTEVIDQYIVGKDRVKFPVCRALTGSDPVFLLG